MAEEPSDANQEPTETTAQTPEPAVEQGGDAGGDWHPPERGSGAVQLAQPRRRWYHWFMPHSSREQQTQTLRKQTASDVGELLHAVSHHLDRQAQVQERLLMALERLPEAIDGMQKVGKSAESQTQVLAEVKKQLESSAAGMSHFEDSLQTLDATNRTAAETVASLIERSRETEEKLRQLVNRSERRMTLLLALLGFAFVFVVGGALYYGVTGRPLPAPFGARGPAYQEAPRAERLPPVPTREPEPRVRSAPGILPPDSPLPAEPVPVDTTPEPSERQPLFRLTPRQETAPTVDSAPAVAPSAPAESAEAPDADAAGGSIIQRVIQSLRPESE